MTAALIALELQAILTHKSSMLTPTEIEALQYAMIRYRHLAKSRERRQQ